MLIKKKMSMYFKFFSTYINLSLYTIFTLFYPTNKILLTVMEKKLKILKTEIVRKQLKTGQIFSKLYAKQKIKL